MEREFQPLAVREHFGTGLFGAQRVPSPLHLLETLDHAVHVRSVPPGGQRAGTVLSAHPLPKARSSRPGSLVAQTTSAGEPFPGAHGLSS